MGDAVHVEVKGLRELEQDLLALPAKLAKKGLVKAARAASNVWTEIAKAKVPVRTGALRKNIRVVIRPYLSEGRVTAYLGIQYKAGEFPGGRTQQPAVYAVPLEFGHATPGASKRGVLAGQAWYRGKVSQIKTDNIKWRKALWSQRKLLAAQRLAIFGPGVKAVPAKPFMRPAFDEGKAKALEVFGEELKRILPELGS